MPNLMLFCKSKLKVIEANVVIYIFQGCTYSRDMTKVKQQSEYQTQRWHILLWLEMVLGPIWLPNFGEHHKLIMYMKCILIL